MQNTNVKDERALRYAKTTTAKKKSVQQRQQQRGVTNKNKRFGFQLKITMTV